MSVSQLQPKLECIVRQLSQGAAVSAEAEALQCTQHFPDNAQGWFLLGVARHMQRRHGDALDAFNQALSIAPDHLQAQQAKAAIFYETGHWQEMLAACEQACALAPGDAMAATNLGTALEKLDRLEPALQAFDRALALDPGHVNARLNRGALLLRLQRPRAALENNHALVAAHPRLADAYYNLADCQLLLHEYETALATCAAGLSVSPRHARLQLKYGVALACLGRFEPAREALASAHTLSPGILSELLPHRDELQDAAELERALQPDHLATSIYLAANLKAQEDCHWRDRDAFLHRLQHFIEDGTPHGAPLQDKRLAQPLLAMPLSPETRLHAMRHISIRVQKAAQARDIPPFRHNMERQNRRLRIGYLSPDFRTHPVGYLSKPLYRLHDRARFEVHCYSLLRAPGDRIQQEIAASCDHWHDLSEMDTVAAAQRIHADDIDILIDLAGYTRDSNPEIPAMRPAPVQAHYLGYPGTSGATFLDYVIVDPIVCPDGYASCLAEKAVVLPETYCLYDTGTPNTPTSLSRADVGLPPQGFVFCCFNASYKIEPTIFALWLRLLKLVPDSILWLTLPGEIAQSNLVQEATRQGVDPQRLIFAPVSDHAHYLARLQLADLFLDTCWHNAHTIAADALWQGLPVLTCSGPHWSSRLGASLLNAVSLPELITESLEQYETLALRLARQPETLSVLRDKLRQAHRSAALFHPEKTVRHLEQAYLHMWDEWLKGRVRAPLPPH